MKWLSLLYLNALSEWMPCATEELLDTVEQKACIFTVQPTSPGHCTWETLRCPRLYSLYLNRVVANLAISNARS